MNIKVELIDGTKEEYLITELNKSTLKVICSLFDNDNIKSILFIK